MDTLSDSADVRRYTTREAAAYLGVSRSWLSQLRHAGKGPRPIEEPRRPGVRLYFTQQELDAWRRQFAEVRAAAAAQRYLPAEAA